LPQAKFPSDPEEGMPAMGQMKRRNKGRRLSNK